MNEKDKSITKISFADVFKRLFQNVNKIESNPIFGEDYKQWENNHKSKLKKEKEK